MTLDDLAGVRAAVQPALDQLEQLRAEQPDNDDLLLRLIQGYEILVTAESRGGATSAAEEAHARALAILRTLTSRQADSPAVRERTGFVLSHLGRSLEKVDLRGALDLYREALRQHEALAGLPGRAETVRRWLAGHHVKIAGALINLGKLAEAEQELERARARLPHASDDESEFEVLQVRADMLLKWSGIYHLTGRKAEALAAGEKEVAIRERILQHDPFVPAHRAALAQAWSHLALFRSAVASDSVETTQISFTDEGLAALQNAVKMFEQLVATCPQTYVYRRSLARSLSNVAYALVRQQRRSSLLAAEQAARRAVEVLAEARGAVGDKGDEDDPDRELNLMNIQATLSDVLFKDGRVREGYEAASRVAEGLAKLTARHPELQEVAIMYARILTGLAQLALEVENLDEARRHAAAARSVVEARFAAELQDPEVREMRIVLARFELEFRAREGDLSVASEAEALIASYGPHEAMGTMAAAGLVHELCWRPALTRDQRAAAALARQSARLAPAAHRAARRWRIGRRGPRSRELEGRGTDRARRAGARGRRPCTGRGAPGRRDSGTAPGARGAALLFRTRSALAHRAPPARRGSPGAR
ncbi:MAG TPA: hypothetical protein VK081_14860 [Planctomycetota bacterium]|nr:hypothetical protein [Planctomycetota bacterium]